MSAHDDLVGMPDPLEGSSLAEVIAFCRANGVRKVTYRGMELEFGAMPAPTGQDATELFQKFSEALAKDMPSDVDLLGWSAGGDFAGDIAAIQKALDERAKE